MGKHKMLMNPSGQYGIVCQERYMLKNILFKLDLCDAFASSNAESVALDRIAI